MEWKFLQTPIDFLDHLNVVWTFLLIVVRFSAMMLVIPGIGGGQRGLLVRTASILVLSAAAMMGTTTYATLPVNVIMLVATAGSEFLLGALLGMVPQLLISGVQTAAMLSSTTMGLGAAQLLDPNLGVSVPSLARLFGDLVAILFMFLGGHYVVIYAVAGFGGSLVAGTFVIGDNSISVLIDQSAQVLEMGVMVSAPVIVALLLTQFVMGLITKAVPTVNIFIVSFPLTIGIGLVLSALSLPEILIYMERKMTAVNALLSVIAAP